MKRITIQPTDQAVTVVIYDNGHVTVETDEHGHMAGFAVSMPHVGLGIFATEEDTDHEGRWWVLRADSESGRPVRVEIAHEEES